MNVAKLKTSFEGLVAELKLNPTNKFTWRQVDYMALSTSELIDLGVEVSNEDTWKELAGRIEFQYILTNIAIEYGKKAKSLSLWSAIINTRNTDDSLFEILKSTESDINQHEIAALVIGSKLLTKEQIINVCRERNSPICWIEALKSIDLTKMETKEQEHLIRICQAPKVCEKVLSLGQITFERLLQICEEENCVPILGNLFESGQITFTQKMTLAKKLDDEIAWDLFLAYEKDIDNKILIAKKLKERTYWDRIVSTIEKGNYTAEKLIIVGKEAYKIAVWKAILQKKIFTGDQLMEIGEYADHKKIWIMIGEHRRALSPYQKLVVRTRINN